MIEERVSPLVTAGSKKELSSFEVEQITPWKTDKIMSKEQGDTRRPTYYIFCICLVDIDIDP